MIQTLIKNKIIDLSIEAAFNSCLNNFISQDILDKLKNPDNIKMIRIKSRIPGTLYHEYHNIVNIEFRADLIRIHAYKVISIHDNNESAIIEYNRFISKKDIHSECELLDKKVVKVRSAKMFPFADSYFTARIIDIITY